MVAHDPPTRPSGGDAETAISRPLRLLYVCTANLCRSVTAEELTNRALAQHDDAGAAWVVRSAGLDVESGARVPIAIREAMERLELPVNRSPRQLDEFTVADADLILTAERVHRARIVRGFAGAVRKTYTVRQFARFCEAGRGLDDPGFTANAEDLMQLVALGRTNVQPVPSEHDDIADPTRRGSADAMIDCARVIRDAVRQITGT